MFKVSLSRMVLSLTLLLRGKFLWVMTHECVAIDANKESVTATVSFVKGGKNMKRNIQCSLLVGADGAGSTVRRLTKVEMRGERDIQKLISVHFMSRELGEYLINNRPGMLFFISTTEVSASCNSAALLPEEKQQTQTCGLSSRRWIALLLLLLFLVLLLDF